MNNCNTGINGGNSGDMFEGEPYTVIDGSHLKPVNCRSSLRAYISDIWELRYFIWGTASSTAFKTGSGTRLGRLWIVLGPLLNSLMYALLFGVILQISRGIDNFVGFLVIGTAFFGITTAGFSLGNGLVRSSKMLVQTFDMPLASVALSRCIAKFLDFIPLVLTSVVVALVLQLGEWHLAALLLIVPLYLLAFAFVLGVALVIARISAFVPDSKAVIPLITRGLFFFSGVFYSVERFATQPVLREIMIANPFYQFLNMARTIVLKGESPVLIEWSYIVAWSLGLLLFGLVFCWRAEGRYANVA